MSKPRNLVYRTVKYSGGELADEFYVFEPYDKYGKPEGRWSGLPHVEALAGEIFRRRGNNPATIKTLKSPRIRLREKDTGAEIEILVEMGLNEKQMRSLGEELSKLIK